MEVWLINSNFLIFKHLKQSISTLWLSITFLYKHSQFQKAKFTQVVEVKVSPVSSFLFISAEQHKDQ